MLKQVRCQIMMEASEEHFVLCQAVAVAAGVVETFVEGIALAFAYTILLLLLLVADRS
jgi:hypothetical protein